MDATHRCEKEGMESQLHQELSDLVDQHNIAINDMKMAHSKELEAAEAKIKDLKEELICYMSKGNSSFFNVRIGTA